MLCRNKKHNDPNENKWIGIGGKFEPGESPDECMLREVFEETSIKLESFHFHGIIHFYSEAFEDEDMYLYSAPLPEAYSTTPLIDCNEGTLEWIPINKVMELNLWEGDRIFLKELINDTPEINMSLYYDKDGKLSYHIKTDLI